MKICSVKSRENAVVALSLMEKPCECGQGIPQKRKHCDICIKESRRKTNLRYRARQLTKPERCSKCEKPGIVARGLCSDCHSREWRLANHDRVQAACRRFRQKNKETLRLRREDFFQRNPDKKAEYNARHRAKYPEHLRELRNQSNLRLRKTVIAAYGGVCVCCGESQFEFLVFDHVNNDGAAHRRSIGIRGGNEFCRWLKHSGFPPIVQILCFNCNSAKEYHGRCPHIQQLREAL